MHGSLVCPFDHYKTKTWVGRFICECRQKTSQTSSRTNHVYHKFKCPWRALKQSKHSNQGRNKKVSLGCFDLDLITMIISLWVAPRSRSSLAVQLTGVCGFTCVFAGQEEGGVSLWLASDWQQRRRDHLRQERKPRVFQHRGQPDGGEFNETYNAQRMWLDLVWLCNETTSLIISLF